MQLHQHISQFSQLIASEKVSIYNEFSLQHELGIYLRKELADCKVEFERNVSHFKLNKANFEKKEIDISVVSSSGEKLCAIEIKFPRNGRVPDSMFDFCKDIAFLEQLVSAGFKSAYFIAFADDKLFYSGSDEGIYGLFRNGMLITGKVNKQTKPKDGVFINIAGAYTATWVSVFNTTKYCLIKIDANKH